MADYRFKQESGANFKVSVDDMADALEDTNNLRQIVNDLATLLGHSKQDDSYPDDGTTGGFLKRLNYGLDADKTATPAVNDMYLATDTVKIYRCFVATNWVEVYPGAAGLLNIVEDLTPQLGGELDAQAHSIGFTLQTGSGTGDQTIDWRLGNKMKFTIGAATTFIFTAPTNPCNLLLHIIQDGTGGRDIVFPGTVTWLGDEPTWTDGGISKTIIVAIWYDGTNYWCQGTPWQV